MSSLYTNIPHDEGVSACCEALAESGHTSPPIDDLKALMYDVLTKNNFTFMCPVSCKGVLYYASCIMHHADCTCRFLYARIRMATYDQIL